MLTDGMAKNNITAQVQALFPNMSLNIPAAIPPKIPPTSNKVDKSALLEALRVAVRQNNNKKKIKHCL